MKKIMGVVLILLGVVLVFNKQIYNILSDRKIDELNTVFQEIDKVDIDKNLIKKEEYDYEIIEDISPTNMQTNLNEEDKDSIIGQLVIPSADINLVIFDGISNSKLLSGVTTMKENQSMGKGNYSLAGHYGFKDKLLYNLDKVEVNDEVRITDKNKIYIYKIVKKEIVSPDRLDMIEDSRRELFSNNIISIMNCYYEDGKRTGDRYFITGELVKEIEYDEKLISMKDSIL